MVRDLTGLVVLVVDDDPDVRFLLRQFVEQFGATVREARDGYEALAQVDRSRPHLILCDLKMPGLDGFGFIERLRQDSATTHIPVIAVSGLSSEADVLRSWASGFSGHLVKPVTRETIGAQIDRLAISH